MANRRSRDSVASTSVVAERVAANARRPAHANPGEAFRLPPLEGAWQSARATQDPLRVLAENHSSRRRRTTLIQTARRSRMKDLPREKTGFSCCAQTTAPRVLTQPGSTAPVGNVSSTSALGLKAAAASVAANGRVVPKADLRGPDEYYEHAEHAPAIRTVLSQFEFSGRP